MKARVCLLFAAWLGLAMAGCEWREITSEESTSAPPPSQGPSKAGTATVVAMPVSATLTIDGKGTEAAWADASATTIPLEGYSGDRLTMRALYNDSDIFFLVSWPDYSHSIRQAGSWERVHVGAQFGKVAAEAQDKWERFGDEDALSWVWNLDAGDVTEALNRIHLPNAQTQSGKMDRWYWAAGSTGAIRLLLDQHLTADGMHDDSGTSFLIPNFTDRDDPATPFNEARYPVFMPRSDLTQRKIPKLFAMRGEKPILLYYHSEVTAFDLALIDREAKLPGYVFSEAASGSVIDVEVGSTHDAEGETWTLELRRKRVTDTPQEDVQFSDLNRAYGFAIGVFDNTPIDGSFSQAYQLTFAK